MDYVRNHVIAGGRGDNPALVSVNMEPVRLNKGMEVAVKSIAVGDIFNVSDKNKDIMIEVDSYLLQTAMTLKSLTKPREDEDEDEDEDETSSDGEFVEPDEDLLVNKRYLLTIPKASYTLRKTLCLAVVKELNRLIANLIAEYDVEIEECVITESADQKNPSVRILTVTIPDILLIKRNTAEPDDIFSLLSASFSGKNFSFRRGKIENSMQLCFIYMNIVQQSQINGYRSRVVAPFPMYPSRGYTFFEFQSPTYIPIEVREFSMVTISLLDIKGNIIGIDNRFDTVATLHFRQNPVL